MTHSAAPGAGYVHPRAAHLDDHDFGLEIAPESTQNYNAWIAELCRPFVGMRTLEIGAGYGAVTRFLSEGVPDYFASDISPDCLDALEQRFAGSTNITVQTFDVLKDAPEGEFDSVIMINVLEHILDDAEILRSLRSSLAPNGCIVLYVPALNRLYGDWDKWAGHFRRYSRSHLTRVMQEAGLSVVCCRYVNVVAIPAWFVFSKLGTKSRRSGPDETFSRGLELWDRSAVRLTRWLERRWRPPVGLNIFAVGR